MNILATIAFMLKSHSANMAQDAGKDLKWVTTKNGHKIALNENGKIVHGFGGRLNGSDFSSLSDADFDKAFAQHKESQEIAARNLSQWKPKSKSDMAGMSDSELKVYEKELRAMETQAKAKGNKKLAKALLIEGLDAYNARQELKKPKMSEEQKRQQEQQRQEQAAREAAEKEAKNDKEIAAIGLNKKAETKLRSLQKMNTITVVPGVGHFNATDNMRELTRELELSLESRYRNHDEQRDKAYMRIMEKVDAKRKSYCKKVSGLMNEIAKQNGMEIETVQSRQSDSTYFTIFNPYSENTKSVKIRISDHGDTGSGEYFHGRKDVYLYFGQNPVEIAREVQTALKRR